MCAMERGLIISLLIAANIHLSNQNQSHATLSGTSPLVSSQGSQDAPGRRAIGRDTGSLTAKNDMLAMMASTNSGRVTAQSGSPDELRQSYHDIGDSGGVKLDWRIKLDKLDRYELKWGVEYEANEIIFAININTSASNFLEGYDIFALGFSSYGQLESSDLCLIWYDLGHEVHVQDARIDSSKRLGLVEGGRCFCELVMSSSADRRGRDRGGRGRRRRERHEKSISDRGPSAGVKIVFKRPLDVCDPKGDYYIIDNGTTHLLWFTLKGPLVTIDGLNLSSLMDVGVGANGSNYHRGGVAEAEGEQAHDRFEWGMERVQLIAAPASSSSTIKSNDNFVDVRMDNFAIPAQETTYQCKLVKLPRKFELRRYHISRYEAVIERANEHVVHHMELFNCANLDSQQERELAALYDTGGGWSGACDAPDRPKVTSACRKVVMAWAMGAQPLVYPPQVGQSIGGAGYSPFAVLEVHYNNVRSSGGLMDNSGLRFHYTNRLRPFDAGILEVGLEYTDKNSIPPNMVTPLAGHCVSECTRAGFVKPLAATPPAASSEGSLAESSDGGERGIYIFAAQMHTHLTGVASWTEQVRGGRLLREIQRDDHYSPHFQEIRLLPAPVHVAPGDALIHYCLYDTRTRINVTMGGFATSEEMCVTYLHYYPRVELEVCKSSVDTRALETYFGRLAREEAQTTSEKLNAYDIPDASDLLDSESQQISPREPGAARKSVSENYQSIQWSPRRSRELIQFYAAAPLSVQCNRSDGERFPGHWNGIPPTKLWPLVQQDDRTKGSRPGELSLADLLDARPSEGPASDYRGRGYRRRHARCKL